MMVASIGLLATSCYKDELPATPVPANVTFKKMFSPFLIKIVSVVIKAD